MQWLDRLAGLSASTKWLITIIIFIIGLKFHAYILIFLPFLLVKKKPTN